MLNMMQIHFLAHGFTDIHEASAWSQDVLDLAEPTGLFYRILWNAGSLDAWITRMSSILQYAPRQWIQDEAWTTELKDSVREMWKLFKSVWSDHDDERVLDLICTTATARALEEGCFFSLARAMDPGTSTYTKKLKFQIEGSDPHERYKATSEQARRNEERNERRYMPSAAQARQGVCRKRVMEAAIAAPVSIRKKQRRK